MKKCSCYDEYVSTNGLKAVCNGTRERDECNCGGDKKKCDFYPEMRNSAKKDDSILVNTIVKIEDLLKTSGHKWEMRYDPDTRSYNFIVFQKEKTKYEFYESENINTYRELAKITRPESINDFFCGGVAGCPDDIKDGRCPYSGSPTEEICHKCWDRPIDWSINQKENK